MDYFVTHLHVLKAHVACHLVMGMMVDASKSLKVVATP
jgi:hypothetical protein